MKVIFLAKIIEIFLNPRGRFSRETFVIIFLALLLLIFITSRMLLIHSLWFSPGLSAMLLPWMIYIPFMIYVMFVLCLKRLHDLNMTGWASISLLIPILNIFFIVYLCLKKGKPGNNNYERLLNYDEPSFFIPVLITMCCAVLGLYIQNSYINVPLKHNVQNTGESVKQVISSLPRILKEELKKNPRSFGVLFINDKMITTIQSVTANSISIHEVDATQKIKIAFSEKKRVKVRFPDNSVANITKLIIYDASAKKAIFEMDRAIGTPGTDMYRNQKTTKRIFRIGDVKFIIKKGE